jgi:hypothetical protein
VGGHVFNTLGRGTQILLGQVYTQRLHAVDKIRGQGVAALTAAHIETNVPLRKRQFVEINR